MTDGSILPTAGPVPPNVPRAVVPRELRPDIPNIADRLRNPPEPEEPEPQENRTFLSRDGAQGRPIASGGLAAVSAQEGDEPAIQIAPPPAGPSEATRRLSRAIEEATRADDGENARGLTEEEEAYVRELKAIDREVRAHEQAHVAKGGAYAGQPNYTYVTGPDGVRYAVAGTVQIDTGTVPGDPEATIRKLETVRQAALAPAQPSAQDRSVAAQAEVGIREAEAELREQRAEEAEAEASGDAVDDGAEENSPLEPSTSALINEDQSDEQATGNAPFATNLLAQAAFSQAALTQPDFSSDEDPQRGIDLIA